jgi:hypothetical protein
MGIVGTVKQGYEWLNRRVTDLRSGGSKVAPAPAAPSMLSSDPAGVSTGD